MTRDESKNLAMLLGKLFPGQLTPERYRFVAERFLELEAADVEKAIKEHRAAREFVTENELLEGCRAVAKRRIVAADNTRKEGTWADVYRRQREDLRDATDFEVVLRVHRGWWMKCGKSDGYRRQFEHSCVVKLQTFGMDLEAAQRWTAAVFDDSPDYFRQCLEELRAAAAQPGQGALATVG